MALEALQPFKGQIPNLIKAFLGFSAPPRFCFGVSGFHAKTQRAAEVQRLALMRNPSTSKVTSYSDSISAASP